ncbi:hypothetical protein Dimus_034771 [Dionaea muscipula]
MPINHLSPNFQDSAWLMDPTRVLKPHHNDNELPEDATDEIDHSCRTNIDGAGNYEEAAAARRLEREPMFEKSLTPSDVGKLNRLVIPKQHAERYFPLGGTGGGGESVEKGLLLSFEDESGKYWRFRYSYWNSSQSYVLTKGWSRYVKEKRLDAGDVVSFERHGSDADRLFIGWRRKGAPPPLLAGPAVAGGGGGGGALGWSTVYYNAPACYPAHSLLGLALPREPDHVAGSVRRAGQRTSTSILPSRSNTRSVASISPNSKTLRLFGVNLECHEFDNQPPSVPQSSANASPTPMSENQFGRSLQLL